MGDCRAIGELSLRNVLTRWGRRIALYFVLLNKEGNARISVSRAKSCASIAKTVQTEV